MFPAELNQELVEEILIRLPVKPLLRFRCVSKTWRSLIDSSSFVKSHLSKNPSSKIYLFSDVDYEWEGPAEMTLSFAEIDLLNCSSHIPFQSLTLPLVSSPQCFRPVGSCDGLLCVTTQHFKEINLVNPSTREYRPLPPPIQTNSRARTGYIGYGLGYDCSANEYKVVLVPEEGSKVNIYGSKSNAWREKDVSFLEEGSKVNIYGPNAWREENVSFKYDICSSYGKYANGALHWNCSAMDDSQFSVRIKAFDLATEKFTVSEYDKDLFGNPTSVNLTVLGGQLCLCCTHNLKEDEEGHMEIWVMEDYGVKGSWSKLVSFDRDVLPLAFSICGTRLLLRMFHLSHCTCSLHWYDLNSKSVECFNTSHDTYFNICLQSLVRLERKLP